MEAVAIPGTHIADPRGVAGAHPPCDPRDFPEGRGPRGHRRRHSGRPHWRHPARAAENSPVKLRHLTTAISTAAVLLWAGDALAATYYVSPAGSPTNPGSPAAPWPLSKANSALAAGDVVILQPGDYGTTKI